MTEPTRPPNSGGTGSSGTSGKHGTSSPRQRPDGRHSSTSSTGSPRVGRRDTQRARHDEVPAIQRLRTPILALIAIVAIGGVSLFVLTSATSPAYACTTVERPQQAAANELGQVQPDMGNGHVQTGDKVTFPVCPPASGKHVNKSGFGPLQPKVYGPNDQSLPSGWIHNLEHGGLVLLYACDKGACDDASLQQLRDFSTGFPNSPVCGLSAGTVGPVVARFEQMPTKYAALVWDRVLYLDTLDNQKVYDFYTQYGERIVDGTFVAPPEPQCPLPSSAAPASESPAASGG